MSIYSALISLFTKGIKTLILPSFSTPPQNSLTDCYSWPLKLWRGVGDPHVKGARMHVGKLQVLVSVTVFKTELTLTYQGCISRNNNTLLRQNCHVISRIFSQTKASDDNLVAGTQLLLCPFYIGIQHSRSFHMGVLHVCITTA